MTIAGSPILFITRTRLGQPVRGGITLCSQRFRAGLAEGSGEVHVLELPWERGWTARLARWRAELACGWPFYAAVPAAAARVRRYLQAHKVDVLVVDEAETAAAIGEVLGELAGRPGGERPRLVLFSHGLYSQDHLYDFHGGSGLRTRLKRILRTTHQGRLPERERALVSRFDAVWHLNEMEEGLLRWLGARTTRLMPQVCVADPLVRKPIPGRYGFVGSLTHPINVLGLDAVLEELARVGSRPGDLEVRIVGGAWPQFRRKWQRLPFVSLLGRLDEDPLKAEAATWWGMIHPIFHWAKGRSMKVTTALEWGLPIWSTRAGVRGYDLEPRQDFICGDEARGFAQAMLDYRDDADTLAQIGRSATRKRDTSQTVERLQGAIRAGLDELLRPPLVKGDPPLALRAG